MLIDVTRLADRLLRGRLPTGVDRVGLAYVAHYQDNARALVRYSGHWIELDHKHSRRIFTAMLSGERNIANDIRRPVLASAFKKHKSKGSLLLNVVHSGLDDPAYAKEMVKRQMRPVFFLHDLIPLTHPEYCRPGEAGKHQRRLDTMWRHGRGLIMNSAVTRQEWRDYLQRHHASAPPDVVAALPPADMPPAGPNPWPQRDYFVCLGTIEPRKNHLLLLNLWRQLVQEQGDNAPGLVLLGQRGWECEQVVDMLERCQALEGHVMELGTCDDLTLSAWLFHARGLLFPSFVEGYGIPLVEALAHKVPVIASRLAVFREIAADIPDYLDPLDGPGWKQAIQNYRHANSQAAAQQRQRMQHYSPPDWQTHFALVDELLAQID